jgi:putative ABC transport system permease protein
MFLRILWRLLWASRGRLALALGAVATGAAVCTALVNLDLDAGNKFTREFRSLGANVIVAPAAADAAANMDENVMAQIEAFYALNRPGLVAAAPYLYIASQTGDPKNPVPVIVAGTWFNQVARMNSWWKVDGQWITDRNDSSHCMAGQEAARLLGLSPGSQVTLRYGAQQAECTVAGIVTSGSSEDSQIFVNLQTAQDLAELPGRISMAQLSVEGAAPVIERFVGHLSAALPGAEVRPVRQLAAAEGRLLDRIRGLLFATVLLILALSVLGVLAATTGLAMDRRRDVGLMKAIGGPVRRVMRFFLAETMLVAIGGGIIGGIVGLLLSQWIGRRVFAAAIAPRPIVLPFTIAVMICVALAGALPLRLLGRVRPAEILRGE